MTVTCAVKVPRERFESSRRTQPAQLLKSGCTGSDDDTTDPRLAGFTDDTDDVRFKFIASRLQFQKFSYGLLKQFNTFLCRLHLINHIY